MKILFAASEAVPFIKSGGLADVAGSLTLAMRNRGQACRVVLPLYEDIPQELKQNMKFLTYFNVSLGWRNQYCGVFESTLNGLKFYFLDNEYYFKRRGLYGFFDDGERFAFFSKAILEMVNYVDFSPEVIHCNDWQTALVPVYRHVFYAQNSFYAEIKTVFTIHNIAYQGLSDFSCLGNLLGLPDWAGSLVEFEGNINLLKGAIETSHAFTTVSPNYAKEIAGGHADASGYDFGRGLTPFIRERAWKLTGIRNGVDENSNDPSTDCSLYQNYSKKDFRSGKKENKIRLQERLGLASDPDVPLVAIVSRIDARQKGCQLVIEAIERGLMDNNRMQFVLLGAATGGDREGEYMEHVFKNLEERYRGRLAAYIGFVHELAQKVFAAADIFLVPSRYEPCGLTQMIAMRYGAIPVVRSTGGLADTVADSLDGKGNGFVFNRYDGRDLLAAIERALGGYENTQGWGILVKRAMECGCGWDNGPSDEYIQLYKGLL